MQEVKDFFSRTDLTRVQVSDFSLHALGVIYVREHEYQEFLTFVNEDIIASGIRVLSLVPDDFSKITDAAGQFHLDFDDAFTFLGNPL
jgi:hypothetical protein